MQLFDSDGSFAATVATFVQEGLVEGDKVVIVTTEERWHLVSSRLASRRVSIELPLQSGRLVFMNARWFLQQLMGSGSLTQDVFDRLVVPAVRELALNTNRLRIYGDTVDLLAATGDYATAHRLEVLWNELRSEIPFQLFCGYSAPHFAYSHQAEALRVICRCHSDARSSRDDTLSSRLLDSSAATARA